jgi:hypothetical protein
MFYSKTTNSILDKCRQTRAHGRDRAQLVLNRLQSINCVAVWGLKIRINVYIDRLAPCLSRFEAVLFPARCPAWTRPAVHYWSGTSRIDWHIALCCGIHRSYGKGSVFLEPLLATFLQFVVRVHANSDQLYDCELCCVTSCITCLGNFSGIPS